MISGCRISEVELATLGGRISDVKLAIREVELTISGGGISDVERWNWRFEK